MNRVLYTIGCGLGNQVQALYGLNEIKKKHPNSEISVCFLPTIPGDPRAQYAELIFRENLSIYDVLEQKENGYGVRIKFDHYYGSLYGDFRSYFETAPYELPQRGENESEISFNIRCITNEYPEFPYNMNEKPFLHDWMIKEESEFDVVIGAGRGIDPATGTSPVKGFDYWDKVAEALKYHGISVASVGVEGEAVKHTEDLTGMHLIQSASVIYNAKVFAGNDSGLYHLACSLGVPNVTVFCGLSAEKMEKNFDPRFYTKTRALKEPFLQEVVSGIQIELEKLNA